MLDIDFLKSDKPTLRHHAAYIFKKEGGVLKREIVTRLAELYATRGLMFKEADYDPKGFLFSVHETSLFGGSAVLVDLTEAAYRKVPDGDVEQLVKDLLGKFGENSIIFVMSEDHALLKNPNWLTFAKTATMLEEPTVNKNSMEKLLDHFMRTNALYDFDRLKNKALLRGAFNELYEADRGWTLSDIQQQLDFFALTCIDTETDLFDAQKFRQYSPPNTREDFYRGHKIVADFLVGRTRNELSTLVAYFDTQQFSHHKEPRMLVGQLHLITKDLFKISMAFNPKQELPHEWKPYKLARLAPLNGCSAKALFWWYMALMRWEPEMGDTNLTYAIHQMGNQFLTALKD